MSLYGTMRTGVSGMNAQANRLGTVAENIANSSTVGYKKASVQFSSMILPTTAGAYNSGGVETDVRYSISSQGTFSYTTSSTDLAVNGDGFFIVEGGDGVEYLTRAGSFVVQDDGTLKNSAGYTLMGYEYSSTADPTIVVNGFNGLEPINLSSAAISATASTAGELNVNLPSNAAVGDTEATSLVAYDSQGNSRLIEYTYTKLADNTWSVNITQNGTSIVNQPFAATARAVITGNLSSTVAAGTTGSYATTVYDSTGAARTLTLEYTKTPGGWDVEAFDGATSLGTGSFTFDASGNLTAGGSITVAAAGLGPINVDFSGLVQTSGATSVTTVVDGNAATTGSPLTLQFDANGQLFSPSSLVTAGITIDGANLESMNIDISTSSQLAADFSVEEGEINGNAASEVVGYEIDEAGVVSVVYDNGDLTPRFRVALASVQSPDNLNPVAGNLYTQSNSSGVIVMGYAGTSGFGSIISGALEDSNVDVAEELTAMIESQRNYTANSKVFQTGSELMEVLVNLKR